MRLGHASRHPAAPSTKRAAPSLIARYTAVVRRIVPAAFASALLVGACNGGDDSSATSYGGYGAYGDGCHAFSSCTTCTPVNGCGWCFNSDGTGMCTASPDECATPVFSWTWNPSGCRVAADASAVQAPEASSVSQPAEEEDAAVPGATDAPPPSDGDAARPLVDGAASTDGASAPLEASVD
jgi:hypothetical protein